jgi:hypothetical protein
MEVTTSGNDHKNMQDVYEWWRSRSEEIQVGINTLRKYSIVEKDVLHIMEELLKSVKIRTKMDNSSDD